MTKTEQAYIDGFIKAAYWMPHNAPVASLDELKALLGRGVGAAKGFATKKNLGAAGIGAAGGLGVDAGMYGLGHMNRNQSILKDPQATIAASDEFKGWPHQALMALQSHPYLAGGAALGLGAGAGAIYAHNEEKEAPMQKPVPQLPPQSPEQIA